MKTTKSGSRVRATKRDKLQEKLSNNFPYREACSRWVEPENRKRVIIKAGLKCDMNGGSIRIWSNNGKWSGNDSWYILSLRPSETFEIIGGMVTVFSKRNANKKVMKCTWFSQSRGFTLNRHQGFLVCGYHVEASTKKKAIATAKAARTRIIKKDSAILTPKIAERRWGFCRTGIKNFMEINNIEKNEITFQELRNIVVANREINCRSFLQQLRKIGIILNCNNS